MALLCGHVGRRRTNNTMALALCVVCVAIAVVGPTMVIPQDRGGLGMIVRFGLTFLVYLCRCGARLCDRRVGAA